MARLATWVVLVVAAAVLVGCGPAKELPDAIAPVADPGDKGPAVPAASEPAAKAYIDQAVRALTGNKPELLARGKASRLVLKGTMLYPVENQSQMVGTQRTIAAVWPDRFYALNEMTVVDKRVAIGAWLRRPHLTVMNGADEFSLPNRTESEQVLAADATAQHWLPLLLPATDPKAVVFDYQKQMVSQKPLHTMKLSLGSHPLFFLTFDDRDVLTRVEYTVSEMGARRRKQWNALESKPGPDGRLLPSKTECRHDGLVVEEWVVEKWDFPAAIDDAEFNPPKG